MIVCQIIIIFHLATLSPSGASAKMIVQYAQQHSTGKFSQYDHGREDNMQVYGQPDPPLYYVENVKVPVSTYYGENDWLAAREVKRDRYEVRCLV
jgi:hypothetical protein